MDFKTGTKNTDFRIAGTNLKGPLFIACDIEECLTFHQLYAAPVCRQLNLNNGSGAEGNC